LAPLGMTSTVFSIDEMVKLPITVCLHLTGRLLEIYQILTTGERPGSAPRARINSNLET